MTLTPTSPTTATSHPTVTPPAPLGPVVVDLYRDIHKGIRTELFDLTAAAGRVDPSDPVGRAAVAAHVRSTVDLLRQHAEHEDAAVQPAIEVHLPALAERIAEDHEVLEARIAGLADLAEAGAPGTGAPEGADRADAHRLYLELADFTSAYLRHQDLEERQVMPALEAAVGPEATLAIHTAIVSNIPPDEMARSLALMLPAMNVDDRVELLGGMQAGAPPEVFEGVWGLAASVLEAADLVQLGRRLGRA